MSGTDAHKAEALLTNAQKRGAAVLGSIAHDAVGRLLQKAGKPRKLFTAAERKRLADVFAAVNGTAELLGRARIRQRQAHAEKHKGAKFSNDAPFEIFVAEGSNLHPMAPREAVEYFTKLTPRLGLDPARFGQRLQREAFTLAEATDQAVLERVQKVISERLGTGRGSHKDIEGVLDAAGISPRNPQYGEMTMRTNMMDSFTEGMMKELQDPDVAETFPVWKYLGIRDGRQGKDHGPHFDRYYPNSVSFQEIRGKRVYNCRCVPSPVSKWEWKALREQGVAVSRFSEKHLCRCGDAAPLNLPDIRQTDHYSCGAAAAAAVGAYFGVGPTTLPEWKKALGTDVEQSTRPQAIIDYLRSLGLKAEAKEGMTIADLVEAIANGSPVICPVQDYGRELPKEADFDYGHYLVVIGLTPGYVVCQDSSEDNVTRDSGTIAAPGRALIRQADWLRDWHDQDIDGNQYVHYGIVVSPAS